MAVDCEAATRHAAGKTAYCTRFLPGRQFGECRKDDLAELERSFQLLPNRYRDEFLHDHVAYQASSQLGTTIHPARAAEPGDRHAESGTGETMDHLDEELSSLGGEPQ